jgi:hypothetical protein
MLFVFASGCANSKLGDAAVAGANRTVKSQNKSNKGDGNNRSNRIAKESFINGAIAFVFCLFSGSEKCKSNSKT